MKSPSAIPRPWSEGNAYPPQLCVSLTADTKSVSVTSTASTTPKFRNKDLGYGEVRIGLTHKREMSLGEGEVTTSQFCLGEEGAIIDLSGGSYH